MRWQTRGYVEAHVHAATTDKCGSSGSTCVTCRAVQFGLAWVRSTCHQLGERPWACGKGCQKRATRMVAGRGPRLALNEGRAVVTKCACSTNRMKKCAKRVWLNMIRIRTRYGKKGCGRWIRDSRLRQSSTHIRVYQLQLSEKCACESTITD
jgi:hypothetical protein